VARITGGGVPTPATRTPNLGLVQKQPFWGNSTDLPRALACKVLVDVSRIDSLSCVGTG
jgi:hypothetical protein